MSLILAGEVWGCPLARHGYGAIYVTKIGRWYLPEREPWVQWFTDYIFAHVQKMLGYSTYPRMNVGCVNPAKPTGRTLLVPSLPTISFHLQHHICLTEGRPKEWETTIGRPCSDGYSQHGSPRNYNPSGPSLAVWGLQPAKILQWSRYLVPKRHPDLVSP